MSFDNSDPKHARVNPLRARKDKPHIWFEEGYWRVSPRPIRRRQAPGFRPDDWEAAHAAISEANSDLRYLAHAVRVVAASPLPPGAIVDRDGRAYVLVPLPPRTNIVNP